MSINHYCFSISCPQHIKKHCVILLSRLFNVPILLAVPFCMHYIIMLLCYYAVPFCNMYYPLHLTIHIISCVMYATYTFTVPFQVGQKFWLMGFLVQIKILVVTPLPSTQEYSLIWDGRCRAETSY